MRKLLALLALCAACCQPLTATPLTEMRADDLLMLSPDIKTQLKLTDNQARLWEQTEARAHALLRERVQRRERLQSKARELLSQGAKVELRDLGALMDAETATSAAEEKQLREWWLTVNDALDDSQRQLVATNVIEQMLRQPAREGMHEGRPGGDGGQQHQRGMGRGRQGGGMGNPGRAGPGG